MPTLGVLRQTNLVYAWGLPGVGSRTFDWSESENWEFTRDDI